MMAESNKVSGLKMQLPRPNECTYWVTNYLIAGEHPGGKDGEIESRKWIQRYLDCGITCFIDLTHEGEKKPYKYLLQEEAAVRSITGENLQYCRFSIPDFGIPTMEQMNRILDKIDDAIEKKQKVYVHCRGGIGRTGTTVGCFLA